MVLGKLGRERVAILKKGAGIEQLSNIAGLIYIPYRERVQEARTLLAGNLQEAGFGIRIQETFSSP